jgi:hypothetical protein
MYQIIGMRNRAILSETRASETGRNALREEWRSKIDSLMGGAMLYPLIGLCVQGRRSETRTRGLHNMCSMKLEPHMASVLEEGNFFGLPAPFRR